MTRGNADRNVKSATLAVERPQRPADARDHRIPGALLLLRIDQVEAMDGAAGFGREIAAAVEDQSPALRRDREEAARHPLVVEHAPARAQVVPEVARRRVAGLVLARVDGQQRAPVGAVEALAQSLLRFAVRNREDA